MKEQPKQATLARAEKVAGHPGKVTSANCRPACAGSTRFWAAAFRIFLQSHRGLARLRQNHAGPPDRFRQRHGQETRALFHRPRGTRPEMLRYQQQYTFFDESKLGRAIRFIN